MSQSTPVDTDTLREQVQGKYRAVAVAPNATYHFHTGREAAARCGYDPKIVDAMPDRAVESFAGVANPFALRTPERGERVVDAGSGAGFDSFVAAVSETSRFNGWCRYSAPLDLREPSIIIYHCL